MPIRRANETDYEAIAEMGLRFFANTKYHSIANLPKDEIDNVVRAIIHAGAVFVAESDGVVFGFIACTMQSVWFCPSLKYGQEMAWWIEPKYRGRPDGIRLLRAFEQWSIDNGASFICMSDIVVDGGSPAGSILERLGYSMSERTFIKELA